MNQFFKDYLRKISEKNQVIQYRSPIDKNILIKNKYMIFLFEILLKINNGIIQNIKKIMSYKYMKNKTGSCKIPTESVKWIQNKSKNCNRDNKKIVNIIFNAMCFFCIIF